MVDFGFGGVQTANIDPNIALRSFSTTFDIFSKKKEREKAESLAQANRLLDTFQKFGKDELGIAERKKWASTILAEDKTLSDPKNKALKLYVEGQVTATRSQEADVAELNKDMQAMMLDVTELGKLQRRKPNLTAGQGSPISRGGEEDPELHFITDKEDRTGQRRDVSPTSLLGADAGAGDINRMRDDLTQKIQTNKISLAIRMSKAGMSTETKNQVFAAIDNAMGVRTAETTKINNANTAEGIERDKGELNAKQTQVWQNDLKVYKANIANQAITPEKREELDVAIQVNMARILGTKKGQDKKEWQEKFRRDAPDLFDEVDDRKVFDFMAKENTIRVQEINGKLSKKEARLETMKLMGEVLNNTENFTVKEVTTLTNYFEKKLEKFDSSKAIKDLDEANKYLKSQGMDELSREEVVGFLKAVKLAPSESEKKLVGDEKKIDNLETAKAQVTKITNMLGTLKNKAASEGLKIAALKKSFPELAAQGDISAIIADLERQLVIAKRDENFHRRRLSGKKKSQKKNDGFDQRKEEALANPDIKILVDRMNEQVKANPSNKDKIVDNFHQLIRDALARENKKQIKFDSPLTSQSS